MDHTVTRQPLQLASRTARLSPRTGAARRRLVTAALYITAHEDWARDGSASAHAMFKAALTDLISEIAPDVRVEPYKGGSGRLDGAYALVQLEALHLAFANRDRSNEDDVDGPSPTSDFAIGWLNTALNDYVTTARESSAE
ncbi:hypothetical protein [Spirillospora sp. CA-128828]|uniref:hypothetical protein n=1 Tax=Spirillospora sp. CA-128828 TaxID=3240033 RepID=UPI003D8FCC1A